MADHPITPPPELLQQWIGEGAGLEHLATQAARWGADQQLNADCEWYEASGPHPSMAADLRAAMRPKPPSLKERALRILVENGTTLDGRIELEPEDIPIIRRALEALPE